jgi:hypothetical protein
MGVVLPRASARGKQPRASQGKQLFQKFHKISKSIKKNNNLKLRIFKKFQYLPRIEHLNKYMYLSKMCA